MRNALAILLALGLAAGTSIAEPVAARPRVEHGALATDKVLVLTGDAAGDGPFVEDGAGLIVTATVAGGPFAALGLRAGDLVLSVNGAATARVVDLRRALQRAVFGRVLYVELVRKKKAVLLRYVLSAPVEEAAAPADPATGTLDPEIARRIHTIDDVTVEIEAAAVDAILADPMAVAKGARVMPSSKDGVANGFRLYAVRPGSLYARLGFANGDTVHTINGISLDTMDHALEAFAHLRGASQYVLGMTRRGKPIELTILVR